MIAFTIAAPKALACAWKTRPFQCPSAQQIFPACRVIGSTVGSGAQRLSCRHDTRLATARLLAAVPVRSAAHGQEDSDDSSRGARAGRVARRGDGPGARAAPARRAGQVRFLPAVALV